MENKKENTDHKLPDNEGYETNNPQKQTTPSYNSTTSHREGAELPAVENLNQNSTTKNELTHKNNDDSDVSAPKNDASLYGKNTKTDLGGGQRDDDEDEDEKIITP